jgi:predicted DsbA family dithiol-disulfide isomerase
MFATAGLDYAPPPDVVPNSRKALQVTELARDLGRHEQAHDRLMDAYWSEGQNIGDLAVLQELAADAGLPEGEVEDVLAGNRYVDRIQESTRQALAIGATGVPAWLLDRRLLVLGAQPREAFEQAFEQLQS